MIPRVEERPQARELLRHVALETCESVERNDRVQPHGPNKCQYNGTLGGGLESELREAQRPGLWGTRCLGVDPVEEAQAGGAGMDTLRSLRRWGCGVTTLQWRRTWRGRRV